eukprot:c13077_g4_i2.p1 GENE.c13077_g4_i2~~c13077_g4_i2.p1  ORF type:complete len:427 (+),score=89.60 c13077_g4_i2:739-2019(+)
MKHCGAMLKHARQRQKGLTKKEAKVTRHPPTFTILVSLVQIGMIGTSMMSVCGGTVAEWGVGYSTHTTTAVLFDGTTMDQQVQKPKNMWFGPEPETFVKWGAKYSPCMRTESVIQTTESEIRSREYTFGCCILASNNNCGMMSEYDCQSYDGKFSGEGVQCDSGTCSITLRPCCYGLRAECQVLTHQYCNILGGKSHNDTLLCSKVNCLEQSCGMGGFRSGSPDQMFRLVTPVFMHIGVAHVLCNLLFQMNVCRELEELCGFWRLALVYALSGVGGNLMAGVFGEALSISAGASSSLYGLIGMVCVDLFFSWRLIHDRWKQLLRLTTLLVVVFGIGTLPYVDNFAHVGGFCIGVLSALIVLPNLHTSFWALCGQGILKVLALFAIFILLALFLSLFIENPSGEFCSWCHYLNCIPWTKNMCQSESG